MGVGAGVGEGDGVGVDEVGAVRFGLGARAAAGSAAGAASPLTTGAAGAVRSGCTEDEPPLEPELLVAAPMAKAAPNAAMSASTASAIVRGGVALSDMTSAVSSSPGPGSA